MELIINVSRFKDKKVNTLVNFYKTDKANFSTYENECNAKEIVKVINALNELADQLSIEAYNAYGIE